MPDITGAEASFRGGWGGSGGAGLPPGHDPATAEGLKGHTDRIVRKTMRIDGRPNPDDVHSTKGGPGVRIPWVRDTGEHYDCVIVGSGASGLAAAKFYKDRFGEHARILLLDPLEDYGGHATRNEFHVPNATAGNTDVTILRNGGTFNLDSVGTWNETTGGLRDIPGSYGQPALDMLDWAGVDPFNFPSSSTPGIPSSYGLRSMLLFPAADWGGTDTLAQNRIGGAVEPNTEAGWTTFVNRLPWSQAAKDAIVAIQTDETTDWLTLKDGPRTVEEKLQRLTEITYKAYLKDYVGAPEEAILQYQRNSHSLLGAGVQAVSAADCWLLGQPGFEGLGLGDPTDIAFPGVGRTPQFGVSSNADPSPLWPDGNSSLMRLIVSKLIPAAVPDVDGARPTQETIVKATTDYSKLDLRSSSVRIRLRSLVAHVQPRGKRGRKPAEITYVVLGDGSRAGFRVRANHVIMACWNRVTAQIVDGLPDEQVQGLCYARKVPLIYGRAALRNWQAFADAKISSVAPRGNSLFWDTTSISAGAKFGTSYGPTPNEPPGAPAMLNFTVVPSGPTTTPQLAAYEVGRQQLLQLSFADLEGALWDVIDRSVNKSGGDFDPARDVDSIMVNRWNYGYAHELTSVFDPSLYGPWADQPQVVGRRPFRNVSIANSDSGAFAYTHSAFAEAYRAVQDLPG
jgi:spermidine dehydrogenase